MNAAGIGGGYSKSGGTITISDSADVHAQGGSYGAGIGGGDGGDDFGVDSDGGDITISGGTVTSSGGSYGAGIGGGDYGKGGDIRISGGIVKAYGANYSAGIGSGRDADGGNITISGTADVTATGGMGAAGIGGGDGHSGGVINISGGKVTATGGTNGMNMGAGIGSGSAAGDITISGGIVFATGAGGSAKDIGNGSDGSGGTLSISGDAAVFMKNDRYITPVNTTTHTHLEYTTDTEESYGYDIPSAWTPTFGSFLRLHTLSYNVNNGSGTAPASATQLYNTTITISNGSGLSRTDYEFGGWNTAANGSGTSYAAGSTFTFSANTMLYAKWTAVPTLSSSVTDGKIYTGGRITLTPNISGGTWTFDSAYFSREDGTFTALKAGTSTITYTVGGGSTTYTVIIAAAALPETGQSFTWVWVLGTAAVIAMLGGLVTVRRKRRTMER
jgi:LPXTG-motif cell wall-anchored protein